MVESLTAHKGARATSNYTPILCKRQTMNIGTLLNLTRSNQSPAVVTKIWYLLSI